MVIRGVTDIRDAYRKEPVARNYIDERFRQPLGALLHDSQVRELVDVITREQATNVLEIAPGPARVTLDVATLCPIKGVIVDASLQMLGEARKRLAAVLQRWRTVQGDAFSLPFSGPFDLVYTFRLIRHFESPERLRLYEQIARVLKPGGLFVFDAVNEVVSAGLRGSAAPGEYQHYDALLRPDVITSELRTAGFDVVALRGV